MQSSAAKPKPNKLPPSQLIGFVKRHRTTPVATMTSTKETHSKLPHLPASTQSPQETRSKDPLATQHSPSSSSKRSQLSLVPVQRDTGKVMATETRQLEPKMKPVGESRETKQKVRELEPLLEARKPVPVKLEPVKVEPVKVEHKLEPVKLEPVRVAVQPKEELCCTAEEKSVETVLRMVSPPQKKVVTKENRHEELACTAAATSVPSLDSVSEPEVMSEDNVSTESVVESVKGMAKRTTEEWQQKADAKVQKCLEVVSRTKTVPVKSPDAPLYLKEFSLHLGRVYKTYFFKNLPLSFIRKSRLQVADVMLSSGTVKLLSDTVVDISQSGQLLAEDTAVAKNHRSVARVSLSTLMNYSDCSDEVTYSLRDHPSFLQELLKWLREWSQPHLAKELESTLEAVLKTCLSVMHNVSMRDDNGARLRELDATSVLLPYLESHNDIYKLSAYASLADIVTEEEADKLSTSPKLARFLLKRLENALKAKDHRCYGWSVTELVRAVRRLARNDANKRLLVEQGALPLLSEGVKSSFEDEKMGCMEALWVLSFDKDNVKEIMRQEELLDSIIAASKDTSQPFTFRHSAAGILWQCRQEMAATEKYCNISEDMSANTQKRRRQSRTKPLRKKTLSRKDTKAPKVPEKIQEEVEEEGGKEEGEEEDTIGHVMLSYQWADQAVVKNIRDVLHDKGYKVWMDIDNMGGSTLQAMAAAIEDSFVVVVCMSQKYKDSPNCRAEAEYAFQQRKTIIPLIMQQGYRPDGWLGMILGAKLFYDFSGKYSFESRIEGLLKAVAQISGKAMEGEETTDGKTVQAGETAAVKPRTEVEKPIVPQSTSGQRAAPVRVRSVNTEKIKAWAAADVKSWLKKFGLDGTELERLTGKEVAFLYNLRAEAPEFFFKTLDKKLHISTLSGLMSFTDALDGLPTS
ncbi:uncharacterized protein LOC143276783 isoform X2 [Babylonia areolata]|uniref:uncharacterized protein LOC143276783 isoform X2 n=1 Tax=Babylonia areolata TaxID=304850 RepID=UPI003FD07224